MAQNCGSLWHDNECFFRNNESEIIFTRFITNINHLMFKDLCNFFIMQNQRSHVPAAKIVKN